MPLVDVFVQIIEHPLTQRLAPYALDWLEGDRVAKRRALYQETIDREMALLRARQEAGLAAITLGGVATVTAAPAPARAPMPNDIYTGSRYDTGCLVCGKAHLAATAGMLRRAADISQQQGTCDVDCAYYVAAAQREVVNLLTYDWTEEQIAATPPQDQAVLRKWKPALESAQVTLFTGEEATARLNLARAAGALEEAGRFARASGVQHPEAQKRIADAEQWLAATERAEWSPERRTQMSPPVRRVVDQALPAFREQRQFLLNGIQTPEDLDQVAAAVGTLNAQLQAVTLQQLTPEQVQQMAATLQQVRDGFRADVVATSTGGEAA